VVEPGRRGARRSENRKHLLISRRGRHSAPEQAVKANAAAAGSKTKARASRFCCVIVRVPKSLPMQGFPDRFLSVPVRWLESLSRRRCAPARSALDGAPPRTWSFPSTRDRTCLHLLVEGEKLHGHRFAPHGTFQRIILLIPSGRRRARLRTFTHKAESPIPIGILRCSVHGHGPGR
jgi:hypothetical protein